MLGRECSPVVAASRRRSGCHGAAARNVSITLSLAPARSSPRFAPAGRPRLLDFCNAPALPGIARATVRRRSRRSAASTSDGSAAWTAASITSSSARSISGWSLSPQVPRPRISSDAVRLLGWAAQLPWRKHQRARRQHQPRGQRDVFRLDSRMRGERGTGGGDTQRQQGRAERSDAKRRRAAAQIASICSAVPPCSDGRHSRTTPRWPCRHLERKSSISRARKSPRDRSGRRADPARPPEPAHRQALHPAQPRRTAPKS